MSGPLSWLAGIDPTPLFVLSLLPYLAFLWWAGRIEGFPKLALRGFQFTLVFVAVTIGAAVIAQLRYGALLANVDPLHGGAESLLTVSNLLVVLGFSGVGAAVTTRPQKRGE
ncbi:DUF3593 domain-containing protein [Cyanobium sp. Alchichica 3B3-8F6]|uniref:DUF3593 domain-containing protein n=1 Tax=Synechococcales TaxID=1890424 RepID=UPI000B998DFF|nr:MULTISPECIES: DUF3593 domain-containing protein [Synechococcales]MCP9880928.1 DUF3593 domain-containing protein [Cyanobium sp. Alchichica 3B3-8F6]